MSKHKTRSKSKKSKQKNSSAPPYGEAQLADGGELHQVAGGEHPALTAAREHTNKTTPRPTFTLPTRQTAGVPRAGSPTRGPAKIRLKPARAGA